jgi:hypothetical protein
MLKTITNLFNHVFHLDKSIVSRSCIGTFFTIQGNNVLLLGDYLPPDTVDELIPSNGKYILLIAKGESSWDIVNVDVEPAGDDATNASAQNRAIALVEENKNNVQYVVICRGVNKTFATRPVYQGFAQYSYVSKEDSPASPDSLHVDKLENDLCPECEKDPCICESEDKGDMGKSESFEHFIEIKKSSFVDGLVYGVVYEPLKKDTHGDWTTAAEIEKMANAFLPSALRSGIWTDKNHKEELKRNDVEIAQSYIAPCDFTLSSGEKIIKGSWVLVSKVNSKELQKSIEDGEITGYSFAGVGRRIAAELPSL